MKWSKFFKRKYPYAPIAFIGRKNVEKILGADIKKLKKVRLENDDIKKADTDAANEPAMNAKETA